MKIEFDEDRRLKCPDCEKTFATTRGIQKHKINCKPQSESIDTGMVHTSKNEVTYRRVDNTRTIDNTSITGEY